jgi:dihydrofolate reductase
MRYRVLSPTCTGHPGDGVSARHRLEGFAAGESVRLLKDATDVPLRTMGSISVVRQLLNAGLVDRFRLMIFPLLVGPSGREWAFEGVGESELALADVRVLDGRILLAEYAPTGRPIPSRP